MIKRNLGLMVGLLAAAVLVTAPLAAGVNCIEHTSGCSMVSSIYVTTGFQRGVAVCESGTLCE